jgi:DtxR family Mn-dependent transcriptional regulator
MEMYLKSILELGTRSRLVPISALSARLGISVVATTEMIHRLVAQGLVKHQPYRGVQLTAEGRRQALMVIRRHRLWESFLRERLKLPWSKVHELACDLEHAGGMEVTEALAEYLDQPEVCPHGNPIPKPGGEMADQSEMLLTDMQPGESCVIMSIQPESAEILDRSDQLGLAPGIDLTLEEIDPIDKLRILRAAKRRITMGEEMASHFRVRRLPLEQAPASASGKAKREAD